MKQVTQWFTEKPAHVGAYERDMKGAYSWDRDLIYSYWNGSEWLCSALTPNKAHCEALMPEGRDVSVYQDLPWRGIAE